MRNPTASALAGILLACCVLVGQGSHLELKNDLFMLDDAPLQIISGR